MKVSSDKFRKVFREYIITTCVPTIRGNLNQFFAGLAIPMLERKLMDTMTNFDIVDKDGQVDLDSISMMLESGFQASGGKVTMQVDMSTPFSQENEKLSFTFVKDDWEHIKKTMF